MALQQVDTSSGQVSGVDDLSKAASSVVNWEEDESGVSRPRAGLATYTTTNAGSVPSIGLCRWKSYIINPTADRYVRVLPDSAPTSFSVVSTATTTTHLGGDRRATFVIGDRAVYMAGGGQILSWTNDGMPPSTLTSSPINVTHIASLGQYLIANDLTDPSTIFWSDIGEGAWTSWPAANAMTAEARPDPIVGLWENAGELFVGGTETLQVYSIGADPTLPFDQANTLNFGLGGAYAFCRLKNSCVLLDDERRILNTDGRSEEVYSDAIQKTLDNLTTVSDCWIYREHRGQHSLIVARFPTDKRTFVYDLKGSKWRERSYYTAPFQGDFPVSAHVFWPRYNYNLFGSTTSGLLRFDETSRQDIGGPLVCERTGGWNDFGSRNRKRFGRVRATMRRGTAAQGATPGALEVRAQFDDSPWSPWQQLSVGTPEDYKQNAETWALAGIARRARLGVRFSTTEDMSLEALHWDVVDLEAA